MANPCCGLTVLALLLFTAKFASAQQTPDGFLDLIASKTEKLTAEQANAVSGFYNLTEMVRIEGSIIDRVVEDALMAAGGADNVDFANVTAQAIKESQLPLTSYYIWIPHVDAKTGFLWAYRVLESSLPTSFPAVKRFMGVAMARPDGAVALVLNNDQDSAICEGLYKNDTIHMTWLEGIEVWSDDETATAPIEDQSAFTMVLEKVAMPENFIPELQDALPLRINKEQSSASSIGPAGFAGVLVAAMLAHMYIG